MLTYVESVGDFELLEADTTRYEVLPGAGKPYGEVTSGFYAGLLGGKDATLLITREFKADRDFV